MSARHADVMIAIQTTIRALGLAGVASGNVRICRLSKVDTLVKKGELKLPAVVISPFGAETINSGGGFKGDNANDDYGWPTSVVIVEQGTIDDLDTIATSDRYSTWRESLMKAFHNQRLSGITGEIVSMVSPGSIQEINAWLQSDLFASGMVIRTYTRELVR